MTNQFKAVFGSVSPQAASAAASTHSFGGTKNAGGLSILNGEKNMDTPVLLQMMTTVRPPQRKRPTFSAAGLPRKRRPLPNRLTPVRWALRAQRPERYKILLLPTTTPLSLPPKRFRNSPIGEVLQSLLWRSIMAKKSKKAPQTGSREPNLLTIAYAARLERQLSREVPPPRRPKKPRTPPK